MQQLTQLTESLASTAVLADARDLNSLADLHTRFHAISELLAAATAQVEQEPSLQSFHAAVTRGERLVEQIILREVMDSGSALQRVNQTVAELQLLISSGIAGADASDAVEGISICETASEGTAAAPDHATTEIESEKPLNAEDLPLILEFSAEANGHLDTAEAELLKLEDDPQNLETVNAVFRSFHTIKGVAGFLNLKQIGALAHAAENLLDKAREGTITLVEARLDAVLHAIDFMKKLLLSLAEAVAQNSEIPVVAGLPQLLVELHRCAAPGNATGGAASAVASGAPLDAPLDAPSDALSNTPSDAPSPAADPQGSGPVCGSEGAAGAEAAPAQQQPPAVKSAAGSEATVKVATDRLDSLINMVGELVIAQSMVSQDVMASFHTPPDGVRGAAPSQRLTRNMAHLGKITRELQDLSMSMRMVPIQGVFQKMARLVRDVARKSGKNVDFQTIGGETELDRNVVEAISDPLVHMVRNAVDHGIETPEKRIEAGKPPVGKLTLRASHKAGNIVIEITDDGRGINKTRLLQKATQAGIVKPAEELNEQEIFRLIFHAGLSTAEKVTDVSGRGVGMDVVKKNVEALSGRIDIASQQGVGTTFSLRLPLTLAVIDGLVVKVGPERYILPLTSVEQSIRPRPEQISTLQGKGEMLMVRGSLMPLFRLHHLFNVTPRTQDPTEALVVIVHDESRRCSLLVDELLGQQQVVIKTLADCLGTVPGISGGAILGDGNISLILDVPSLIGLAAA